MELYDWLQIHLFNESEKDTMKRIREDYNEGRYNWLRYRGRFARMFYRTEAAELAHRLKRTGYCKYYVSKPSSKKIKCERCKSYVEFDSTIERNKFFEKKCSKKRVICNLKFFKDDRL